MGVGTGAVKFFHLAEDPRVGRCRTANHDGVATGLLAKRLRGFGSKHVPVSDHRNPHGILNLGDHVPARAAAITLQTGAPVNGDRFHSALFRDARDGHSDNFLVAPADADLAGKGNRDGRPDFPEYRLEQG